MVNVAAGVKVAARYAARYGPHAKAAWDTVGQQATDSAKTQAKRARSRRQAFAKARTVNDGAVLRLVHRGESVYVVLSSSAAVESYPLVDVSLGQLLMTADVKKARSSADFEAARVRARAARARRRAGELRQRSDQRHA